MAQHLTEHWLPFHKTLVFMRHQVIRPANSLTSMTSLQSLKFGDMPKVTCTGEALEYPPIVMGTENCSINTGNVPSFPGKMKSKSDHSSRRLFCMGEPDKMIR